MGLLFGKCAFGWNGRGCSHRHPKVCRVFYNTNGVLCEDMDCRAQRHHPQVCHTVNRGRGWICFDQTCLSYHNRWEDNIAPGAIPPSGGWDGPEWRVPGKKLMKEWESKMRGSNGGGEGYNTNRYSEPPQDRNDDRKRKNRDLQDDRQRDGSLGRGRGAGRGRGGME